MSYESVINNIAEYAKAGLTTDGEHHKQHYLYKILETVLDEDDLEEFEDKGIAP